VRSFAHMPLGISDRNNTLLQRNLNWVAQNLRLGRMLAAGWTQLPWR